MLQILNTSQVVLQDAFEAHLLWAVCCLGYFGFMHSGEFTTTGSTAPTILANDLALDSHSYPSII